MQLVQPNRVVRPAGSDANRVRPLQHVECLAVLHAALARPGELGEGSREVRQRLAQGDTRGTPRASLLSVAAQVEFESKLA